MPIFTKHTILEHIRNGTLTFDPPLDTYQLRSHSVDLRLGYTFLVPKQAHLTKKGRVAIATIDPLEHHYGSEYFDVIELEEGQFFEILPGEHVSVSSLESVKIPLDIMAVLYPRSSVSRRGLSVDLTGIIDAGYEGQLIIPIKNTTQGQVIRVYPGERFCQIVFQSLDGTADFIKSRYHRKDIVEGGQKDETTESALIKKGAIQELKKNHPIDLSVT